MFITEIDNRWCFTTQSDHSNLVGQIAGFWGNDTFATPSPLRSMIIAAAEHDHVWVREDHQGLLKPDGVPFDFANLPYDRHTTLYAEGARQVASRDPYAGLMVSLHGTGIYNQRHGTDKTMVRPRRITNNQQTIDTYLESEAAFQSGLKSELQSSHSAALADDVFWTNYQLLQVWDRLGILLSQYQQDDFTIEPTPVNYRGEKTTLEFTRTGNFRFTVSPYPFAETQVTFCFLVRWLSQIKFPDNESYRRSLDRAPRIGISYTFEK